MRKIAFFHNLPKGGAKRTVDSEVDYFKQKNNIVEIFTPSDNISTLKNRIYKDIYTYFYYKKDHKKVAETINNNFDFAIVHPDKHTQAPYILRFLTIPHVYYCHETLRIVYEDQFKYTDKTNVIKYLYERFNRFIRKNIDKKNTQCAKKIVTNSKFTQNNILSAYSRNAIICYPGVNSQKFSFSRRKRNNTIFFVGDSNDKKAYQNAKKIAKKIAFNFLASNNSLSESQLLDAYQSSMYTASLSKNEPFGMVPLEAMSTGSIPIVLNTGGYPETVIDDSHGIIDSRISEIIRKAKKLTKDTKKQNEIRNKNLERVTKHFSWENHGKILENLINE